MHKKSVLICTSVVATMMESSMKLRDLDYYKIGQRIRKYRKSQGMTQDDLAERSGLSAAHLSHIENGSTRISLAALMNITEALGITPDDVLIDDVDPAESRMAGEIQQIIQSGTESENEFMRDMLGSMRAVLDKYMPSSLIAENAESGRDISAYRDNPLSHDKPADKDTPSYHDKPADKDNSSYHKKPADRDPSAGKDKR